jgi:uncharacterized protein (DUF433 family)
MTIPTDIKYIVTDPEIYGGRPIIAGHRIAVIDVAVWTKQGMAPEQIATQFPLTLAQIHAALTYYYDHQLELDKQLAEDETKLAAYAAQDRTSIMERLRALNKSLPDQADQTREG